MSYILLLNYFENLLLEDATSKRWIVPSEKNCPTAYRRGLDCMEP